MVIRSVKEISRLDEELNLFEESAWDFMGVLTTHETNFEYFDDSKDLDFSSKDRFKHDLILISTTVVCFILCFGIFSSIKKYQEAKAFENLQSNIQPVSQVYIDGEVMGDDVVIEASSVLSGYFACLDNSTAFSHLDDYCLSGSNFNAKYEDYKSKIKENYDSADSYARAMIKFAGYIDFKRVDRVIKCKDDDYYCYITVFAPTSLDIEEYSYTLQYVIAKHFSSNKVTEADLLKYIVESISLDELNRSSYTTCVKMRYDESGMLKIVADNEFTDQCINSFSSLNTKMIKMLGSVLTSN